MKEMKKGLYLLIAVVAMLFMVTGCGENTKEALSKDWEEVKEEYAVIEKEAEEELAEVEEVSQEKVEELVKTVEEKYAEVKDGITKENEEVAKELYKAAHQLELLAERSEEAHETDAVKLGSDVKDFVQKHYGDAEQEIEKLKEDIEGGVKTIKDFTEKEWNDFLNLFK